MVCKLLLLTSYHGKTMEHTMNTKEGHKIRNTKQEGFKVLFNSTSTCHINQCTCTKEIYCLYFLQILKEILQNFWKIFRNEENYLADGSGLVSHEEMILQTTCMQRVNTCFKF